jgi:hypothetical protein
MRRLVVVFGWCCGASLMACGLVTSFDGLTGGSNANDANAPEASPIKADAAVNKPTDAGAGGDAEASDPFVSYVPAAGNYEYVQNTSAYADGGDFEASAGDLGVDILILVTSAGNQGHRRPQASTMPARVDYLDGGLGTCWTLGIEVLPSGSSGAHTEEETFCARNGGLLDPGMKSTVQVQTWVLGGIFGTQSSTATIDCSATNVYIQHDMNPGDEFAHTCMGTAAQTKQSYFSNGPYTYVGRETMMTGDGVTEDVFHTLRNRTVTAGITGFEITDFYLSTRDGLPLRIHRHTHIDTPVTAPGIDSVIYDERGSDWLLSSHVAQ